jgi:hypothetical protein
VHIIAGTLDQAREQWVQAAGRNRADLGLDQARAAAAAEARDYAPAAQRDTERPAAGRDGRVSFAERMERVNARLARTTTPSAGDAPAAAAAAADEYLVEYEAGHQQRQGGPRL